MRMKTGLYWGVTAVAIAVVWAGSAVKLRAQLLRDMRKRGNLDRLPSAV